MFCISFLLCPISSQSFTFFPKAMAFNSSSSLNVFAALFSSECMLFNFLRCFSSSDGIIGFGAFTVTNILLVLPLCVLILHIGVRHWRRGSSVAVNHSDFFTYNLIFADLFNLTGLVLTCCGIIAVLPFMALVGTYIFSLSLFAHSFLDILTCVERYLAVVHPITYRNLKNEKGIYLRTGTIGCVWLISAFEIGLLSVTGKNYTAGILITFTVVSLMVVIVCSIAVLCTLIQPGAWKGSTNADQSKLRAFYTILTIVALMMIRIGANVFTSIYYATSQIDEDQKCHLILFLLWTWLPTSLFPSVLFLQRTGKIFCCKLNGKNNPKNSARTTKAISET